MAQYAQTTAMGLKGSAGFNPMEDEKLKQAQLARQGEEERQYQQEQDNFARTFGRGRGLTDGAASRMGRAGQKTNVPPGAVQPHAMGNTYWAENKTGNNDVELSGMLNRGVQNLVQAQGMEDPTMHNKAVQDILKAYNEGSWSSATDATDVRFNNGGIQIIGANGQPINKTPVPPEAFMNIGGNPITGQTVHQRSGGGGTGMGVGGGTSSAPNKMLGDAAKFGANKEYMTAKEELDALINPSTDLGSLANQMKPEERKIAIERAKKRLDDVTRMGQSRIAQSGMQGQTGGTNAVTNTRNLISNLIKKGMSRADIINEVWTRTGDRNMMQLAEKSLKEGPDEQMPIKKASGLGKPSPAKPVQRPQPRREPRQQPSPKRMPKEKKVKPSGMPKRDLSRSVAGKVIDSYKDTNILGGVIRSDLGFKPTTAQIKLAEQVIKNPENYSKELQKNANAVLKVRNRDQYSKRTGRGQMGRAR